jgi:adenosylhomocysteine nucleosidase
MEEAPKIALVAAMEREVAPLVKAWPYREEQFDGRRFRFFEGPNVVLVCGGIGAENARRATEAVFQFYRPESVQSVGLAGALDPKLKIGDLFTPRWVVDVGDGSRVDTGRGAGGLASLPEIAGASQKTRIAQAYRVQAVDMEAAAVARGAQAHQLPFAALKAISDESDFEMPPMNQFVAPDGSFRSARFIGFAACRPWLWVRVVRLWRNSTQASGALCAELSRQLLLEPESTPLR